MLQFRILRLLPLAFLIFPFDGRAHTVVKHASAAERLQHPLIIGASVSSGLITESPGERATEWSHGVATNVARSGACGKEFGNITSDSLASYSAVLAIDFLFWDSTKKDVGPSLAALHRLETAAERAHVPLVLGDIPNLIGSQVSRDVLNDAIHATCVRSHGCYLLDLDELHRRAYWVGVPIDGETYHYSRLTFDGLHLNDRGATYVAQMIVALLN